MRERLSQAARFATPRRLVAFLALAVLLSSTSIGLWHHHNSNSSANCPVCHVAHTPFLKANIARNLPKPLHVRAAFPFRALLANLDPITHHASPRAPPAAA